jgi:hypothetical protein
MEGGGRRRQRFYRGDAAATAHDARVLTPWATALGFMPPCPTAARIWPYRAVQPTVGATLNAVGMVPNVYFSKFLV